MIRALTINIILILFFNVIVKAQETHEVYLSENEILSLKQWAGSSYFIIEDSLAIHLHSCRITDSKIITFFKFKYNKFDSTLSVIGQVRSSQTGIYFDSLIILVGTVNDSTLGLNGNLSIRRKFPATKYSNFDFKTDIKSSEKLFFQTYTKDDKDNFIITPCTTYNVYKLLSGDY
jgi:hypothetical protein